MKQLAAASLLAGFLAPLLAGAQPWSFETVAPFGRYFELAVDAAGNPHIVFSNCQAWEGCDPIDPGQAELTYATKAGGSWTFETIAPRPQGDLMAILVDGAGTPHIAYKDSTYQMRYGYRDTGGWQLEDLYHEVLLRYRASPSLALDEFGEPHIAFIERERIRYAHKDDGIWVDEEVTGSYMDNWSARSPIAFESNGTLHVGGWMYDSSAVFFTRGATDWTYELLNGDIGWNPWMVLDENDAAHFICHGFNGLSYATNTTGTWIEETIDPMGDNTADDIALDPDGRPFVVYTVSTLVTYEPPWLWDSELWLAWRDGGTWGKERLDAARNVEELISNPRLEIDASGTLHLLYHHPATDEMIYGTLSVPTGVPATPRAGLGRILEVWPNPFNPAAEIVFRLDAPAGVTLAVFDVTGRQVRRLVESQLPAGEHVAQWDGRTDAGSAAPSGLYFIQLQTESGSDSHRAILLK